MSNETQLGSRDGTSLATESALASQTHAKNDQEVPRALTLPNFMLVMCFITPFSGAMGFAKAGKCGFLGFLVALAVGIPIGAACVYAMWRGFRLAIDHPSRSSSAVFGVLTAFAGLCWIILAGFLGGSAEQICFPKQSAYLKACRATHTCNQTQSAGPQ